MTDTICLGKLPLPYDGSTPYPNLAIKHTTDMELGQVEEMELRRQFDSFVFVESLGLFTLVDRCL